MIGVYARQSIDKKDSISIESQIDFCKKEFSGEYKEYIDRGFSGGNIKRPAFVELLNDIKQGKINVVVVYKLDRISRSVLDFASIINIFENHNVSFISSTERFDTSTPIGRAMLSIIMVFAQLERETIQKRITDNYYARGKKGMFLGGTIPYGFSKEKTKHEGIKTSILVANSESKTVIEMFSKYAYEDTSLGKISNYLNSKNIPSPSGGRWDSNKISRVLHNPIYVKADADIYNYYKNKGCIISSPITDFTDYNGCYLYGKRKSNERKYTNVENHVLSLAPHEGIIDAPTFLLCQYKLDTNKQIKNSGKGKHTWLVNVKCGYCGYACSVIKSGHNNTKYFNCRGKTNLKICKGHSSPVYVKDIEEIIISEIKNKIMELKDTKIEKKHDNNLKIKIVEIEEKIENLVNQIEKANDTTMKYINEKLEELDTEKKKLIEESQKEMISTNFSAVPVIEQINDWNLLELEEKKQFCKNLIKKIKITDDNIDIEWNI